MISIVFDLAVACIGGILALKLHNPIFTAFYVVVLILILIHNYFRKKNARSNQ